MNKLDKFLSQAAGRLEEIRQQCHLPSLSAAVMFEDQIIWQEACGLADVETKRVANPEMVYPLGSISKVFITTMLMQLVERGVVNLEDPVTRYIPEYQVKSPFPGTSPATLRQLAAHTSGLPRDASINFPMNFSLGKWEFSDGQAPLHWYVPVEDLLASLPTVRLELSPDTAKSYSNLGIMLLGIALERACQQNFRRYISEHIFGPLGMSSAGFVDDAAAWDARFPSGYGQSHQNGALFQAPHWQLGGAIYTGGIYSNAGDLARFCSAFMREPSPLLSTASIQRMIHPAAMGDMHLGWWKGCHAGYTNFGHAGAHVGFISAALFIPELELAVSVQTNRWNPIFDTNDSTVIARDLLGQMIPFAEDRRPKFSPTEVDIHAYLGSYHLPGNYASAEIVPGGDPGVITMTLRGVQAEPMNLVAVGCHQFGPPETRFPALSFDVQAGNITSMNYALFKFYKSYENTSL